MVAAVTTRRVGSVALLVMNSPPVNGLSYVVRSGLVAEFGKAAADPAIAAVVLTGNDRVFSAGALLPEG